MKRSTGLLAAVAIAAAAMGVAALFPIVEAQTPIVLSSASSAEWTHSGLNTKGQPLTFGDAEIVMTLATVTDPDKLGAIIKSVRVPAKAGANSAALATLFAGQPDGAKKLWMRVYSSAGLQSAWAGPVAFTLSNSVPALPTGFKVVVSVQVGP